MNLKRQYVNILLYLINSVFSIAHSTDSGKVYGGRYAKDGEFPFIVSIRGKIICAGSLVTLGKVVTAAHCLADFTKVKKRNGNVVGLYVTGGSVDLENVEGIQIRKVKSIFLSVGYNSKSRSGDYIDTHDIATAVLDHPFYPGKYLSVMNLISWNATVFKNSWDEIVARRTVCYAMGWGMTMYRVEIIGSDVVPANPSIHLKVIGVYPIKNEPCSELLRHVELFLTLYGIVCVFSVRHSETICNGDSGGPLVCDGRPYALLTNGPGCGTSNSPQIYLLYWRYLDFLTVSGTTLLVSNLLINFLTCFLVINYV